LHVHHRLVWESAELDVYRCHLEPPCVACGHAIAGTLSGSDIGADVARKRPGI